MVADGYPESAGIESRLRELAERARRFPSNLSEKDTERALVEPFIDALGYDSRDPEEVRSQFEISIGSMALRCDYVIMRCGEPSILIECKKVSARLDDQGQLASYFGQLPSAVVGIYTNGLQYLLYAERVHGRVKRMDEEPFLELDLRNYAPTVAAMVSRCSKQNMESDPDGVVGWLNGLRYERTVARRLRQELTEEPSEALVRLVMDWAELEEPTQEQTEYFRALLVVVGRRLFGGRVENEGRGDRGSGGGRLVSSRNPATTGSLPTPSGEWVPLDSSFPTTGYPPPIGIRLAEVERRIASWTDVPKEVAIWLHDKAILSRENCEFKVARTRHLLSSHGRHSNGTPFHSPISVGNTGIELEGSSNPDKLVQYTCQLLQRFGQAPSSVILRLSSVTQGDGPAADSV